MDLWDINIRLFHWFLTILILLSIISGKNNYLEIHQYIGVTILGLLIFRIYWGFFGTFHAKFKNFLYKPYEVLLYLKNSEKYNGSHNPLGAISIFFILVVLFTITISGLFSSDDILVDGPLSFLLPAYTHFFTKIHNFFHYILYFIIILHISAIFYHHLIKKEKIINQMIDGKRRISFIRKKTYSKKVIRFGTLILIIFTTFPPSILYLINLYRL